ncbi:MAG: MotA/TolQ/ExbB proton channel family protein [Gemmatimonadota bacterium]|nr:MotA/TolQ/ExbB proton channel family protein [Gemmatimonadota bacterium]
MIALLQVGTAVPTTARDLVLSAGTETHVVLAILVVLSFVSWAIMIGVGRELSKSLRLATAFAREVERGARLAAAGEAAKHTSPNAAQRVLVRALQFVGDLNPARATSAYSEAPIVPLSPTAAASQVETLRLVLDAEALSERDRLGRFLPWLATIGSASPLIGLLGTVLGIITSFLGIATRGSGNLAAVAPGVAAALIATAAALAVAIPATFGYNILANRLNRLDNLLEGFGTTVIAMLVREGRV